MRRKNKIEAQKICNKCGEDKSLDNYYTQDKTRKDGTTHVYYNPTCKSCLIIKAMIWKENNYDKYMDGLKRFYSTPHGKEQRNRGLRKRNESGKTKEWRDENKDKMKQYRLDRQHKNHDITKEEWENCKEYFNNECAYCGLHISEHFNKFNGKMIWTDFHKEHVEHDGANDLSNCVPSCKVCNSSKWTYQLHEWYIEANPSFTEDRLTKISNWLVQDYKKESFNLTSH